MFFSSGSAAAAGRSWRLGGGLGLDLGDLGGEHGESGAEAVERVLRRGVTG